MGRPKGSRTPWKETEEGKEIYRLFIQPFLAEYTLEEGQVGAVEGIESFFNLATRKTHFVRCTTAFNIPGLMWESPERPTRLIPGVGRRYMAPKQVAVLRMDKTMPERSEFEFEEQVFVLTRAQLTFILEKVEVIA